MTNPLKRHLKLSETLVRGVHPHERSRIEEAFKASPTFLRAFADRLEKNLDDKIKDSESIKQYMNTNWTLYQADNKGYRRALRDILNMFIEYK